jgi:hypothetical protein
MLHVFDKMASLSGFSSEDCEEFFAHLTDMTAGEVGAVLGYLLGRLDSGDAAAGVVVVKTGSAACRSKAGFADVAARLGTLKLSMRWEVIESIADEVGIVFVFLAHYAPLLGTFEQVLTRPAHRNAAAYLNKIGPLLSPVRVDQQVIGANSRACLEMLAGACGILGDVPATLVSAAVLPVGLPLWQLPALAADAQRRGVQTVFSCPPDASRKFREIAFRYCSGCIYVPRGRLTGGGGEPADVADSWPARRTRRLSSASASAAWRT